MGTIALEGIRLFGHHGVYEQEQEDGNEFEIDVYLSSNVPPPSNDQLDEVIDYAGVYDIVLESFAARASLLETLANRIGTRILELFREVDEVKVRVSKLDPPLAGECRRSYFEERYTRK